MTSWTQRLRDEVGDGFPDKVTAFRPEMAVHGKYGEPCPVCGTPVQRIVYADNEANYCPTCQTDGRLLADRSLSRLLKEDWPQDPRGARGPPAGCAYHPRHRARPPAWEKPRAPVDPRPTPVRLGGVMKKLLAGFLLAAALAGCGPKHANFVKVDDVALGRVVVYRNGVAYYERRATVTGGMLTVSVPRDRVDDFLKSLTVVDAISKQPLPVSIPREQADDGDYLVMKLQLPSKDAADVVLTYVTESPAWKPSYRVVVGDKGKVMLEGWAIVDNTSGEDWKGVRVGVGSSSALSFKYDLWSVRQVQRETLAAEEKFAVAPPTRHLAVRRRATRPPAARSRSPSSATTRSARPHGHPEDRSASRVAITGGCPGRRRASGRGRGRRRDDVAAREHRRRWRSRRARCREREEEGEQAAAESATASRARGAADATSASRRATTRCSQISQQLDHGRTRRS